MAADLELRSPDDLAPRMAHESLGHAFAAGRRQASDLLTTLTAAGGAAALTHVPGFELRLLGQGAARLAGLLTGSPVVPTDAGFALPTIASPVVITAACSAGDFYWMAAGLIGWRLVRAGWRGWTAVLAAVGVALPVTIFVNALRIAVVAQAHRWVIPRFPASYSHLLHMTTGVAVFLPTLIALNLVLEYHARHRSRPGC